MFTPGPKVSHASGDGEKRSNEDIEAALAAAFSQWLSSGKGRIAGGCERIHEGPRHLRIDSDWQCKVTMLRMRDYRAFVVAL